MEPWPFSHGNLTSCSVPALETVLQWSHGPLAMETHPKIIVRLGLLILQWSHGPLAMETPPRRFSQVHNRLLLQWSHGPLAMETGATRPRSGAF